MQSKLEVFLNSFIFSFLLDKKLHSVQQGTHYSTIAALKEKHFKNEYDIEERYNP